MGKQYDNSDYEKLYNELNNTEPKSEIAKKLLQNHDISSERLRKGGDLLPSFEEIVTKEEYKNITDENGELRKLLGEIKNENSIEYRYALYVAQHSDYRPPVESSSSRGGDDDYNPPIEVCTPINPNKLNVSFDDIAGQEEVKDDMKKTYLLPLQFPNLFVTKSKGVLLYGVPGGGKCLHPEEQVLMFDGTLRQAQHINPGELLMGDDSTPRTVLSTCTGEDDMFKINPSKGEPYIVNSPHIISLISEKGNYIDIPLNNYIKKSDEWKNLHKGYRVIVEWPDKNTPEDSYIFGLNMNLSKIPNVYKINSKEKRIQLIKGIIEKNAYYNLNDKSYEIESKEECLIDDIAFIARSVGYNVKKEGSSKTTFKVCINLEYNLKYSFTVVHLGKGKYCGFELDGNHRFLLKDFTVTHNTLLAKAAVYELKGNTAFFTPTPGDIKGSKHGETEKNISFMFKCAEDIIGTISPLNTRYTSSIIFIDEFDGIGGLKKGDNMMTLSVNALLQKMDGITKDDAKPVSVIAATNYPWNIEEAILRRFSSRVFVDLPDQKAREFMLLEPLHKYFIPPGELKTPLMQNGKFNTSFLDTIAKMGGKYHCNRNKEGDPDYRSISYEDIVNFAVELGPSERAVEIVNQLKNKQDYDPDLLESEEDRVDFGRSGSDISKIMDIAIQEAASRALTSGYFQKIDIKNGDVVIDYYYVSIPEDYIEVYIKKVEVASSSMFGGTEIKERKKKRKIKVTNTTLFVIDEDKLKKGSEEYELIPHQDYNKIYNFSICQSDIVYAIEKYTSTINPKNYINLLRYKYLEKYPRE